MAVQGFFSPDRKTRMAGEKENKAFFSVKVEPVKVASNINKYNEQTPSLDYSPKDPVYDAIRESETRPSYTPEKDTGYGATLEKSLSELGDVGKGIFGIDDKLKEHGVPMSDEEKRATTAYEMTNLKYPFKDRYKFSDTNYDNIQSDYDKYKDLRDRRDTRREAEEAVNKFRSDYMADFNRADYAIRMKQYNPDGTEKDINKYNKSLDEQIDNLSRLRQTSDDFGPDYSLDRFGNVLPRSEVDAYNRKVDAEEAERTRLSKEKAKANYEESQKNVFQKIGDTVGDVFNKLTGTQAAEGSTLQSQGINTSATTNLSQINNADPTVQRARQAVEKAVRQQTGMPSNPGSQRQKGVGESANNLSRHKAGPSTGRGGISRSTSRGQGGGSSSRSKGGVSRGGSRSNTGSKSSARGARGSASSRSRGGTGSGRTSTSRSASKASRSRTGRSRTRCDIRTKINISPLINSNLVKDNLAEVAYFVQEIKK
jgi:hypothetical protein